MPSETPMVLYCQASMPSSRHFFLISLPKSSTMRTSQQSNSLNEARLIRQSYIANHLQPPISLLTVHAAGLSVPECHHSQGKLLTCRGFLPTKHSQYQPEEHSSSYAC